MLEVKCPIGVQGVIRVVFVVDLLPNVNFSLVRPAFLALGGHHPEGGKIAAVGRGENACFGTSVAEGVASLGSHATGDKLLVFALGLERIGRSHGAAHQLSVLHEDGEGRIGMEARPCGMATDGARPDFVIGLRTVGVIEFIDKAGNIFCVFTRFIVRNDAHVALHHARGEGNGAVGSRRQILLRPLLHAVFGRAAIEVFTVAHGKAGHFVARIGRFHLQHERFVRSHGERQRTVHSIYIGVARIETQTRLGVGLALHFQPRVDDGAAIGKDTVLALHVILRSEGAGRVNIVPVHFETHAITSGHQVFGEMKGGGIERTAVALQVGRDGTAGHVLTLIIRIGQEIALGGEIPIGVAIQKEITVHPRRPVVAIIETHRHAIAGTRREGFGSEVGVGFGIGNVQSLGAGRGCEVHGTQLAVGAYRGSILVKMEGIVSLRHHSEREQKGKDRKVMFDHAMK